MKRTKIAVITYIMNNALTTPINAPKILFTDFRIGSSNINDNTFKNTHRKILTAIYNEIIAIMLKIMFVICSDRVFVKLS